jgi:hypothetical protein
VITIFCHSRVGKTTTEVAFEFPSVVLEANIRDRNFRVVASTRKILQKETAIAMPNSTANEFCASNG